LSAVIAAAVPAAVLAAQAATVGLGAATTATTTTTAAAAPATVLGTRVDGVDAGTVRPVANTNTTAVPAKPSEPDPGQSTFPMSETLLLLAGLLAIGVVVRRRQQ
jgi:hypothetical protein